MARGINSGIIGGIVMGFLAKPVGGWMYTSNFLVGKGPPASTKANVLYAAILLMAVIGYFFLKARNIVVGAIIAAVFVNVMDYAGTGASAIVLVDSA